MIGDEHPAPPGGRPGTRETVALLAGLMALNAFAIDAMIPALPDIGARLGVTDENQRQLVVLVYFGGFGLGQIIWGPLADRFGRKPVLAVGVALYTGFAMLCGLAQSFPVLIAARLAMGMSAAVTRILVLAMVRDLFEGEAMARIMSLVFMVFMLVPVLAPNVGQAILLVASWRAIFIVLAGYGLVMWVWSYLRLPETLHPEYRRKLDLKEIGAAVRETCTDRLSLGYTLAMTALFGGLTAYIASIQQIVFDAFDAGSLIGPVFAAVAAPMALASWANARIVGRFGLRRVGHGGLLAFVGVTLLHALVGWTPGEPLWLFVLLMSLTLTAFAFTTSNFGTLAMTNMAAIAGTASSVQGVVGTVLGAVVGYGIGQSFDGSAHPFEVGLMLCGLAGLVITLLTERGRLFAPLAPAEA